MPPSVPPQLGATTARAYRELLKVQRALFRGDAPTGFGEAGSERISAGVVFALTVGILDEYGHRLAGLQRVCEMLLESPAA